MELGKDILVADAGGSSTRWCLLSKDGYLKRDLYAAPINVCVQNDLELKAAVAPADILLESSCEVYFYGAGCANEKECDRMIKQFRDTGYLGALQINSDMVGAARALFGDTSGIACIIGTGSNSCSYDGREIVEHIPPLGYILGDEGSGAAIGKRFLKQLIRGYLPGIVVEKFLSSNNLDISDIYEKVYREPRANKFLASLAPFILEHIYYSEVRAVVEEEFDAFFSEIICKYKNANKLPISFIGSVAYHFSHLLRTAASRHGLTVDKIERTPINGLLKYHNSAYNPGI